MKRRKYLGVALAVMLPLVAMGYLVWVFYSTTAEFNRRSLLGTTLDPAERWFESDPVDPADLHGTWASRAGDGSSVRESVLDFRPDGSLVWTTRVTVGTVPTIEVIQRYNYQFESGRFITTTLIGQSIDGKDYTPRDADRGTKFWKLHWQADDKSTFQLLTSPRDTPRPHLLFRKSPPVTKKE